jgi:hypothetical protein
MASAAFYSATPRKQELLKRSADLLRNFSAENDITSVIYAPGTDVPEVINYTTSTGNESKNVVHLYGSMGLLGTELDIINRNRLDAQPVAFRSNNSGVTSTPSQGQSLSQSAFEDFSNTGNDVVDTGINIFTDAVAARLQNSGLGRGADLLSQISPNLYANIVSRFPSAGSDTRVKISDPSGRISQAGGALQPLRKTDFKVVFPYTPEISINHQSNYQDLNPTHSNYEYLFYQSSVVSEISISATFTARNSQDAEYVLAAQHFFRSATKMFSGNDDLAGLPPIVCRLEGHGDLQFSYVPIVITGFNVVLPSDVDYISAGSPNRNIGRVPTMQTMSITAKPIYSRNRITNEFSLDSFARGNLLGNRTSGTGGFI